MSAVWWLLWVTALLQGVLYLRECRLRDRAEARARALQARVDAVSCRCGEYAAFACVEVDGWHHCVKGRCRPLHEAVGP